MDRPCLEVPTMGKNAPGDAGQFVGESDGQHIVVQAFLGGLNPRLETVPLPILRANQDNPRRLNKKHAKIPITAL